MPINNKDITISLRMNKETNLKLQKLCEIEENNIYNYHSWWRLQVKKSEMIRCLIEAIYEMPEEERKKWLAEHYHRYD